MKVKDLTKCFVIGLAISVHVQAASISSEFQKFTVDGEYSEMDFSQTSTVSLCINDIEHVVVGIPSTIYEFNNFYLTHFTFASLTDGELAITKKLALKWVEAALQDVFEVEVVNEVITPHGIVQSSAIALIRSPGYIEPLLRTKSSNNGCSRVKNAYHFEPDILFEINKRLIILSEGYVNDPSIKIAYYTPNGEFEDAFGMPVHTSMKASEVTFNRFLQPLSGSTKYVDANRCIYNERYNPLVVNGEHFCFDEMFELKNRRQGK